MRLRAFATLGLLATSLLAGFPAAEADHPNPCLVALNGEAIIPLAPNLPQPQCAAIASGEKVTWTSLDVTGVHAPRDIRDNGECFDAHGDTQQFLRAGESFTVQFTWDADASRLRVRAWDTNGEPVVWRDAAGNPILVKTCRSVVHIVEPDGTIAVWWDSFQRVGVVRIAP